jgi:hypothetical protein
MIHHYTDSRIRSGDSVLSPKHATKIITLGPQIHSRAGTHIKTSNGNKLNIQESRFIASSSMMQESQKYMTTAPSNYSVLQKQLSSGGGAAAH